MRISDWSSDVCSSDLNPADNPLGISPGDPHGQDDVVVESGSLHLPIGRPVKMLLRSVDVLHAFYVPEFRAKMELIQGLVTYVWLTPPDRKGVVEGKSVSLRVALGV